MKKIYFQFQCVTWKLGKALIDLPYDDFNISEEVQEQVSFDFEQFYIPFSTGSTSDIILYPRSN